MGKYEALSKLAKDDEILNALRNDYNRKLITYKFIDEKFRKKYKMNFQSFEKQNIVKEKNFLWEIESDAMEWEHAIEGIKTYKRKLKASKGTVLFFLP